MNRSDFQTLADIRIAETESLILANRPDGAYYLAGYSVECALKACIAKLTKAEEFPDKAFALKCFTHDLVALFTLANLVADFDGEAANNSHFRTNWDIVKEWDELSRYQRKQLPEAQSLVQAVTDPQNGILPWIKLRW